MNYYNDNSPESGAWLRELIADGLIPPGEIDERSIIDVGTDDLRGFAQCHFFAGVGGWPLALKLAGWPDDRPVWTGSCPCQSFSVAGKGKGAQDKRDLWPVFFALIRACRPECVFGEQVPAAIGHGWLDRVCANMETENYTVGAVVLGAHSVNAPHIRQRLFWMAHAESGRVTERLESQRQAEFAGAGEIDRLADNAGDAGPEHGDKPGQGLRREPGPSDSAERGGDNGGMVNADGSGRRELRGPESVQPAFPGSKCSGDANIRLENASCLGRRGRSDGDQAGDGGALQAQGSGGIDGLGDSESDNQWRDSMPGQDGKRESFGRSDSSFWSNYDVIHCRDGKHRRIPAQSVFQWLAHGVSFGMDESGTPGIPEAESGFPLCENFKGRNMLLTGFGNAIVPQVAAIFIKASEVRDE